MTSSSTGGGTTLDCEGWNEPDDPGWSLQNCSTDPCPEGEVCRYDPWQGCGADPVCVDPTTWGPCACVDNFAGYACPCPGYAGPPPDETGLILLECNTGMSPWPVQTADVGMCAL